ncbi:hypothetical protein TREMEDRAFT_72577 [Tremella mesenterica DSM 1558]|uniref:uncharacterized protein n=1 Tax=Tremella mesenterica (strain ATCC 24925 / CBS 8224 / DSM 1558 / NBRC 9311 / NRRL Y-6157 / RJB 2259-6 / UBC 559-6) TaxID=578456 RepID=UPI00032C03AE|nr:uncharacterized protein TREMEDRAFT_72577 [Tremella mesenterica DSM 1558]EIW65543.1 hypothetical protein TREMEDRAFT_72577 [Tremella mesenterica DSM 1558]
MREDGKRAEREGLDKMRVVEMEMVRENHGVKVAEMQAQLEQMERQYHAKVEEMETAHNTKFEQMEQQYHAKVEETNAAIKREKKAQEIMDDLTKRNLTVVGKLNKKLEKQDVLLVKAQEEIDVMYDDHQESKDMILYLLLVPVRQLRVEWDPNMGEYKGDRDVQRLAKSIRKGIVRCHLGQQRMSQFRDNLIKICQHASETGHVLHRAIPLIGLLGRLSLGGNDEGADEIITSEGIYPDLDLDLDLDKVMAPILRNVYNRLETLFDSVAFDPNTMPVVTPREIQHVIRQVIVVWNSTLRVGYGSTVSEEESDSKVVGSESAKAKGDTKWKEEWTVNIIPKAFQWKNRHPESLPRELIRYFLEKLQDNRESFPRGRFDDMRWFLDAIERDFQHVRSDRWFEGLWM